jgi:extracellular factor (EF) 3-hydroxypalmitic acid methyl ester biosynthesis protein
MDKTINTNTTVVCKSSGGIKLHGTLLRLSRRQVVLEIYDPQIVLQMSEVLDLKISSNQTPIYSGRAIIRNLVNTGTTMICEATLDEIWQDEEGAPPVNPATDIRQGFANFMQKWQKVYKIVPEYKILIADMQSFLMDLRLWLEQVELEIGASTSINRLQVERNIIQEISPRVIEIINTFFDKFENIANNLDEKSRPVHEAYMKRHLHSVVLCSPFAYRTFQKPLGYAGDYEMVNMMMRETEGNSLFAKIVNLWFLKQPPAEAHRNRVVYLEQKLVEETARVSVENRTMQAFNLGCGPAWEIQKFLREREISNRAQFTLLDFNEETILHTRETLTEIKHKHQRSTPIEFVQRSVQQVIKDGGKSNRTAGQFDLVYCAGLFDYLSDQVCLRLMNIFYDMVRPGGLLLATNVDVSNPLRNGMEHLLDWHLIYRTSHQAQALKPDKVLPEDFCVKSDITGVNIFIEARKPNA